MRGPLREMCEAGMAELCESGLVRSAGVNSVWDDFLRDQREDSAWTRRYSLFVLGSYLATTKPIG